MARSLLPFVQNGYYASRNWIPLVKGNGFTTSGGGEQEEVWETASGPIVTFDAVPAPLRQLSVAVEPVQAGSGDPSPDNVRPISGFDSVTVNRTGKNLVNVNSTENINAYIDNLGIIHANGTWKTCSYIPVEAGKSYCLSGLTSHPNSATDNYLTYDKNKTLLGVVALNIYSYPVTFNASVAFVRFCWKISEEATVMFEQSQTATAYEPYQGSTYTTSLGQTVYGGTLDVVNGKMTVDRAWKQITGGASYVTQLGDTTRFYIAPASGLVDNWYNRFVICNMFMRNAYNADDVGFSNVNVSAAMGIKVPVSYGITTASEANSWLSTNKPTFVYALATPFELTLTPEQIATLQGTNNVWSDAGDVTVEYRAQ